MSSANSKTGGKIDKTDLPLGSESANKKINTELQGNNSEITWRGWVAVLVSVIIYFAATFIATELLAIYPSIKGWSHAHAVSWLSNDNIAQFFFVLFFEAITIALIFGFIRFRKGRIRAIGLTRPKLKDPANSLLGFIVYFPVYLLVIGVLTSITNLNTNQQQNIGFSTTASGLEEFLIFLSLCVFVPIAEEIMFRGFLYSGLKKSLPLKWAALLTSVIFAFPHMLEGSGGGLLWSAGVDVFILSFVLIWLRERTGRLYAGMGLHALKNFVAFAFLFLIHIH